MRQERKEN